MNACENARLQCLESYSHGKHTRTANAACHHRLLIAATAGPVHCSPPSPPPSRILLSNIQSATIIHRFCAIVTSLPTPRCRRRLQPHLPPSFRRVLPPGNIGQRSKRDATKRVREVCAHVIIHFILMFIIPEKETERKAKDSGEKMPKPFKGQQKIRQPPICYAIFAALFYHRRSRRPLRLFHYRRGGVTPPAVAARLPVAFGAGWASSRPRLC